MSDIPPPTPPGPPAPPELPKLVEPRPVPTVTAKPKRSILKKSYTLKSWKHLAFANSATRREAKAILFQELAMATKNGMPLDEALEGAMRTEAERFKAGGTADATNRSRWVQLVNFVVYMFLLNFAALLILMLSSVWAADVERVARIMALRLLPLIRAGNSLSDAMAELPEDYTPEEVKTIHAGEHWNRLPEALESLGKFQYFERDLQRHFVRMAYPAWLFTFMGTVVTFILIFVMPEFKNIYDQLGAPLPGFTMKMMTASSVLQELGILLWLFELAILVFLIRIAMVGNRFLRLLAGLWAVGWTFWGIFAPFGAVYDAIGQPVGPLGMVIIAVVAAVLAIVIGTWILRRLEKFILWSERKFSAAFGSISLFGAPRTTQREARWLGALSLALSSGADAPGALEDAGAICGSNMIVPSKKAAELARGGYSIGEAVVQSGVLRKKYAHRLHLLDGRPDYLLGLEELADDVARESHQVLNRTGRIAEVISVCLISAAVGFVAVAMYLPLFNIPMIVGTDY